THLERRLRRKRGRGWYFNSGTWARLIHIPAQLRQNKEEFAKLFARLQAGTIAAMDDSAAGPAGNERRCPVVSIWQEAGETVAELRHVTRDSNSVCSLQQVPNTRSVVA